MDRVLVLVFLSVIIGTIGQLCIKSAMLRLGPVVFDTPTNIINSGWQIMQQPLIWLALPLYAGGFLMWAAALSRLQLSFAYPLLATGYLINPLAAMILFSEQISPVRWAGILLILLGVILVSRS